MDSENQQRYPVTASEPYSSDGQHRQNGNQDNAASQSADHSYSDGDSANVPLSLIDCSDPEAVLSHIRKGELLIVNSRRRNGLILYKGFHAEFAGPGAAVGSIFDLDCQQVLPVGDLSLIFPESHEDRHQAYLIRRQWIRLTQQFTDKSAPLQRAQMILNQFETYFDAETIARIPDDAFAMLVGVLPHSVRMARRTPGQLNIKVRA